MASDSNKVNEGTSFQPLEPALCANGCGFFGTAATMNLCSKCYRDLRIKEEQAASAKAVMEKLVNNQSQSQCQTSAVDGLSVQSYVEPTVMAEESSRVSDLAVSVQPARSAKVANRCSCCNKKVGVLGFNCRCGSTFCGTHRYPENHGCTFDFKAFGQNAIAKANPVVKADKVERF